MSTIELLNIEPPDLKFPFELRKQISCSFQLTNKMDDHVAFKVKTTNPKKYCVRPNAGVIVPRSICDVIVTMQAQREAPPDMQCKDKFLVQSLVVNPGITAKEITPEMFTKESGNVIHECKLRVLYVSPPRPPSPVREGSDEGSSPRGSLSDNGNLNSDFDVVSRIHGETRDAISENTLVSRLSDEKNSIIKQNEKLRQELELLRREANRRTSGFSFMFVMIVALLSIIFGYLVKKT